MVQPLNITAGAAIYMQPKHVNQCSHSVLFPSSSQANPIRQLICPVSLYISVHQVMQPGGTSVFGCRPALTLAGCLIKDTEHFEVASIRLRSWVSHNMS